MDIEFDIVSPLIPKIQDTHTYDSLILTLEKNIKPKIFQYMGVARFSGDYVYFRSPFKLLLTGEPDNTGSLAFRISTGEWWDNSQGKDLLQASQGSNYGNLYRFIAYFGISAETVVEHKGDQKILRFDSSIEKKLISEERVASPELVYAYYHSQMLLLKEEHLRAKKPFWADNIDKLRTLGGLGYEPAQNRLLFFFLGSEGISRRVHTYSLNGKDRIYVSVDSLVGRTYQTPPSTGETFIVSPDFHTFSIGNFKTEDFKKETIFFTEGEPDAITLALIGFHACNFKGQVQNGEIRKGSPLLSFNFGNAITFSDTGAEKDAQVFSEVLSGIIPDSKVTYLLREDFSPMSKRAEGDTLLPNTDITDLIEEVGKECIIPLIQRAVISKAAQVAYNPEAIIPSGNTSEEFALREERQNYSWQKAEQNAELGTEDNTQGKIAKYNQAIASGKDRKRIELGVFSDAELHDSIVSINGILQKAKAKVTLQSFRFNCASFVSEAFGVKECVRCPVYKTRKDLAGISTSWIQNENSRDLPPFEGAWRIGSNSSNRVLGMESIQERRAALLANGIACGEAHLENNIDHETYSLSWGNGAVKAIADPSYSELLRDKIKELSGIPCIVLGYYAPITDDEERTMYFVIFDVKEDPTVSEKDLVKAKIIIEKQWQSLSNIGLLKKSFPEWKTDDSEIAIRNTVVDAMKIAGYYGPYHLFLSLIASATSGIEVKFPNRKKSEYIGLSIFVYGEASSGKTYLARIILMLLHGDNVGCDFSALNTGEFRASALKYSSFSYAATQESVRAKKESVPLQVKNDGNFIVIDEVTTNIPGLTHDVIGQLLWDGQTTRSGILNEIGVSASERNNNVKSYCPFVFLANISELTISREYTDTEFTTVSDKKFIAKATKSVRSLWTTLDLASPDMAYKRILPVTASRVTSAANYAEYLDLGLDKYISFGRASVLLPSEIEDITKNFWTSMAYLRSRRKPVCFVAEDRISEIVLELYNSIDHEFAMFEVEPISLRRKMLAFANLSSLCRGDEEITEEDFITGRKLLSYVLEKSFIFDKKEDDPEVDVQTDKIGEVGEPYTNLSIRNKEVDRFPITYILDRQTRESREEIYDIIATTSFVFRGGGYGNKVSMSRVNLEKLLKMYNKAFPEYKCTIDIFIQSKLVGEQVATIPIEAVLTVLNRACEIEKLSADAVARWIGFSDLEKAMKAYKII